jgi:hypothetical protein
MVSRVITDKPVPSNEEVEPTVVKSAGADPAKQLERTLDPGVALASRPGVVIHERTRADGTKFSIKIRTH